MNRIKALQLLRRIESGQTTAEDAWFVYCMAQTLSQSMPYRRDLNTQTINEQLAMLDVVIEGGVSLRQPQPMFKPVVFTSPPIDESNNGALKVGQIIPVKVFARSHRLHKTAECDLGVLGSWSVDGEGRVEAITELMKLIGVRSWCLDDREVRHVDQGVIEHLVTIHRLEDDEGTTEEKTPAPTEEKPQPVSLKVGDVIDVTLTLICRAAPSLSDARFELEFGGQKIPCTVNNLAPSMDKLMKRFGVIEFGVSSTQLKGYQQSLFTIEILSLKPQAPQS